MLRFDSGVRFIQVYEKFGHNLHGQIGRVEFCTPSLIYFLSEPSTPESVVSDITARVCRHGCRIPSALQFREERLSVCRLSARGGSAGRLCGSGLRGRGLLCVWFAGLWVGSAGARTFAPESPCPPCLIVVGAAGRLCVQPLAMPATRYAVAAASGDYGYNPACYVVKCY